MFESIFIGTSGLIGFSKSLRVISNNLANVNTPGFKGSQLQFADFFYQGGANQPQNFAGGSNNGSAQFGAGVNTLATEISFRGGALQNTGNALDLAINGNGFFILKDGEKFNYTRSGQFTFNDGFLVSRTNGFRVQAFADTGQLGDVALAALQSNPAKATTSVKFTRNLPSDPINTQPVVISAVNLFDQNGGLQVVSLTFALSPSPAPARTWTVTAKNSLGTVVGTPGTIAFDIDGRIIPASSKFTLAYTPVGSNPISVELDFSNATSNATGNGPSTLTATQDGYGAGELTGVTFNAQGVLQAAYSNGQTVNGAALALARFDSEQDIKQLGGNLFNADDTNKIHFGRAGTGSFGNFTPGALEGSNVDLAQEFSNLIVAQRGYQASSRVVSTANELVQELFDMKGRN